MKIHSEITPTPTLLGSKGSLLPISSTVVTQPHEKMVNILYFPLRCILVESADATSCVSEKEKTDKTLKASVKMLNFQDLPDELILKILSYVSGFTFNPLSFNLERTSSRRSR